jgi:uracil-DNA glycosylase
VKKEWRTGPGACNLCPRHAGAQTICIGGTGPRDPALVIVDQMPSRFAETWCRHCQKPRTESCVPAGHRIGQPGVGYASQPVFDALFQAGIDREDVFYTTIARCAGEAEPTMAQMVKCRPYLLDEFESLDWQYCKGVVLIGTPTVRGITMQGRLNASDVRFRSLRPTSPSQIKAPVRATPDIDSIAIDLTDLLESGQRAASLPSKWTEAVAEVRQALPDAEVLAIDLEWHRDGRIRMLSVCDGSNTVLLKTPTPLWEFLHAPRPSP